MSDGTRRCLSDLKDELVRLEAQPWGNVESWIAKATPIVRSDWPEHLGDFRNVTLEPKWAKTRPSASDLRDNKTPTPSASQIATNKEKAEATKRKIAGFLDGILATKAIGGRRDTEQVSPDVVEEAILEYLKEQYLRNPSQRPAKVCPEIKQIMEHFGLTKPQCYELAARLESLGLVEWVAKEADGEFANSVRNHASS